ncbi:MAG: DUF4070 domain-containing protein [Gammaproteobacteria bacterium]
MVKQKWHKAVLIYPEFDTQDTFWSYERSLQRYLSPGRFGRPKRLLPPLGLLGLYNHLKPYYRQLLLIDRNVDPRPLEDSIADAEHVYMGGMLAQQQSFLAAAATVKQAGKTLIAGGTAIGCDSPLCGVADHLIENEAETVIDALLAGLADGTAQHYYRGGAAPPELFFRPDYAAIDLDNYVHMAVQISRGCPEACEFCDIPERFGKNYRVTPRAYTAAAFKQLAELGWKGPVFIVDDNFIGNPRKALEILKDLYDIGEALGVHHPKYTELTLRLADDTPVMAEIRQWLRRTHFTAGFYGVETPNKAALRETRKVQNLRGVQPLAGKLRTISEQTGGGVLMGMIFGFDNDSAATVDEFIDFVNATHAPIVMAGLLNALPKTGLMQRMQSSGRFIHHSSGNNSDGVINFIPYHLSVREAESCYVKILQAIYRPDNYFARVFRHLQLADPAVQGDFRSGKDNLRLAVKILSRENAFIYWKYLPAAHAVGKKRFGFNTPGYCFVLAEYLSLCGQYTHFRAQTRLKAEHIPARSYAPWQCYAWKDIQASPVAAVEILEKAERAPLCDRINIRLQNGYETNGTRWQIMQQFADSYVQAGLKTPYGNAPPGEAFLIEIQVEAYRQLCAERPEIVGDSDFSAIESRLRDCLRENTECVQSMRRAYRNASATREKTD